MPNLQDPVNFSTEVQVNNHSIYYANLMEICQGGPVVGDFFVNGVRILPVYKFGGPLLVHLSKVYVPVFIRRFCIPARAKAAHPPQKPNIKTDALARRLCRVLAIRAGCAGKRTPQNIYHIKTRTLTKEWNHLF